MRNSHLMIYGSSYDRGLDHLLKMWPDIKKEVPDAELHIFYGWNLFLVGYKDNPERMAWMEKMNKMMEQPGITHLGRISHEACIVEHQKAGVWAYPTHFGEISCITAMRAQAYGSVPCVINYAALKETVQFGVKIEGDIYEPEVRDLFRNSLIALLKDEKYQEQVRKEMMPWAKEHYAWSNVAKQWTEEFKRVITPEETAMQLILRDEPLEALAMLPKSSPLRPKLLKKLEHIFNYEKYLEKYANGSMDWKPEVHPEERFNWIMNERDDAKSLIDIGCYDAVLVKSFGKGAKGVELCKEAVKFDTSRGLDVVQGNAVTYSDENKYDMVCALELIEHVPEPQKLIDNLLKLVSDTGWIYISTPNGCYDPVSTKKVWDDENAMIDHVRTYNKQKLEELLKNYEYVIEEHGKEIYLKFRRNLTKEVETLMDDNQALKAWDLVKDTTSPLKERVWLRVKHAFSKGDYNTYYRKQLTEVPVKEEIALDCTKIGPRFTWLIKKLEKQKPSSIIDLGCADGYLGLTLAHRGIKNYLGVNLFEPSLDVAKERTKKYGFDCKFTNMNFMDIKGKFDAVVMFEILEHLPDPKKGIIKAMRLLNPGGVLYISTPRTDHIGITQHKQEQHESWDDGLPAGHLRVFTEEEVKGLLSRYIIKELTVDEDKSILVEVVNHD